MRRSLYLVVFAVVLVVAALGGLYLRHRAVKAASGPAAAANCDTPAPAPGRVVGPPPAASKTPPPKLPGFQLEPGCAAEAVKKR